MMNFCKHCDEEIRGFGGGIWFTQISPTKPDIDYCGMSPDALHHPKGEQ
jgi:hypothetical protein